MEHLKKRLAAVRGPALAALFLALLVPLLAADLVMACPACNALYKKQIEQDMEGTLIGEELMAAMAAQRNLPLDYSAENRELFTDILPP